MTNTPELIGTGILAGVYLFSLARNWPMSQLIFGTATLVAGLRLAGV
jgi:hypothetical protein